MICSDCFHIIKRQYLKEDERCFCLLDGMSVSLRLVKCDRYRRRDAEDVINATNVGDVIAPKTLMAPLTALSSLTNELIKPRKKGWPKGKKRK